MTARQKRREPRAGGSSAQNTSWHSQDSAILPAAQARPFVVIIRVFAKSKQWGAYSTEEHAQHEAAALRRHGFDAIVEPTP